MRRSNAAAALGATGVLALGAATVFIALAAIEIAGQPKSHIWSNVWAKATIVAIVLGGLTCLASAALVLFNKPDGDVTNVAPAPVITKATVPNADSGDREEPRIATGLASQVTSKPGQQLPDEAQIIADLQARAAQHLLSERWEAFRQTEAELEKLNSSARPTAILQTTKGAITLQLFPDYAPHTVQNFIDLATGKKTWRDPRTGAPSSHNARFYDGTIFHRVIPGYLIQGGDRLSVGTGGPGYQLSDEFHPDLTFDQPYMLAMANVGPDSNGSQFFITLAPDPQLTNKYTIFGIVREGQDVVGEISRVPTGRNSRPIDDIVLERAEVHWGHK